MNNVVSKTTSLMLLTLAPVLAMEKTTDVSRRDFAAASYSRVVVQTVNGKIISTVNEGEDISLTLTRWARYPAGKTVDLEKVKITVDENTGDGVLTVKAEIPKNPGKKITYGCDVEISLPSSIFIELLSVNGSITANGHKNGLEIRTTNGQIQLDQTSGDAFLKTTNGAITVTGHEGNVTGKALNGEIYANVLMPLSDGNCCFETLNGKITVCVPQTVGAKLFMKTVNGLVKIKELAADLETKHLRLLEGTLGDGSGSIHLSSVNGAVILDEL